MAGALSPTEVAAAREVWIGAGLDVAKFDEAARADGLDPQSVQPTSFAKPEYGGIGAAAGPCRAFT